VACVYADDAYLLTAWPVVATGSPRRWLVTFAAVDVGPYVVTINGLPYTVEAGGAETLTQLRDAMLLQVSVSLEFASSPLGPSTAPAILVTEAEFNTLSIAVTGPAPGSITLTQLSTPDNATERAFWLERAKCGVIACCYFGGCPDDFTLYHASLAAHLILLASNTGPTGHSAADFDEMRLGPAMLRKAAKKGATAAEDLLLSTAPGSMVLALKKRYLPPAVCA